MAPLLPTRTLVNSTYAWIDGGTVYLVLGAVLIGLAFGIALSTVLFASPASSFIDEDDSMRNHEIPAMLESEYRALVDDRELDDDVLSLSGQMTQNFANQDSTSSINAPSLPLHEGSRAISKFEMSGGWRLTPEVLGVSEIHPKAKILSKSEPHVLLFDAFLTKEEIDHILNSAKPHMSRSRVVSGKNGAEQDIRTSYGAWLTQQYLDQRIIEIEQRIHDAVGIPAVFGEGIYVLRYENGQKYEPHTDNCAKEGEKPKMSCLEFLKRAGGPDCGEGHGGASCGDRIATFIMYLKSPIEGGETVFPRSRITQERIKKSGRTLRVGNFEEFCTSPLFFKILPKAGDAVLLWDYIPNPAIGNHKTFKRLGSHKWMNHTTEAINDRTSLHGGCPVLKGEKWIATKWIRSAYFA